MNVKRSKLQRKYLNSMRQMGDVPWPPRKYKIAPIFGDAVSKRVHVGDCQRKVAEQTVKSGRLKRKQQVDVICGGRLIAKLGSLGKRRVYCEDCRARAKQQRLVNRLNSRAEKIGALSPQEQIREERRSVKMLQRFRKAGAR